MKKYLLAGAAATALLAASSAAHAADLPPPFTVKAPLYAPLPYDSWSGFYVGVNGGGGWGRTSHGDPFAPFFATGEFRTSGGLFGATAGYNYQLGHLVLGLEGDIDWANIRGSASFAPGPVVFTTELRWLGTVRGRLGYAWNGFLPYVTGGLAVGDVRGSVVTPLAAATGTDTRTGWTVGAGLEYSLTRNLSLKAEYLFVDLGSSAAIPGDSVDFASHIVRAGLNWRFDGGGPVVARY